MGFGSPWKLSKAVFCISAELCTDPVPMQTDEGEILEEGSPKVSEVNATVFWKSKSLLGCNGAYME